MLLMQLHWQWIENGETVKTELRAQRMIESQEEMRTFFRETNETHPLPEGAIWLACNEKSRHFVMTILDD